ncbi:MAG: nucleotidyltransferase family protein [Alphaproteobacteria bacterium]|nr:nucleotidyltransferase family protein [Alphaproteobacteria bacterium]
MSDISVKVVASDRIDPGIRARRSEILSLAARHGASHVRVFGSTARGEAGPDSDIDLLVAMDPRRSLVDHIALAQDLEDLLGRRIDLVTEAALNPLIRDRVLAQAVAL